MDFIKKNLVFVIISTVLLCVSAVLIYLTINKYSEMNLALRKVDEGKQKIDELNTQKPAPLKQNLEKLELDKISFEERLAKLRTVFGKPYRTSVACFAEPLGITEGELLLKFKTHWDKERKLTDKIQILEDFLKQYDKNKLAVSFAQFKEEAQKQTLEPIDSSNINDILLDAFGLPRTMSAIACKSFLQQEQDRFTAFFRDSGIALDNDSIVKFSFEDFGDRRLPGNDEIPSILKHWQIIDDMAARMRAAKIKKFISFSRQSSLQGVDQRGYVRHTYQIKVLGEMNDIRSLVNQFQEAYKNDRIYVINDISLELSVDEIAKLENPLAAAASVTASRAQPQTTEDQKKLETLPYYEKPNYATPLLGADAFVRAEIEFDYIAYTGDELKSKSK